MIDPETYDPTYAKSGGALGRIPSILSVGAPVAGPPPVNVSLQAYPATAPCYSEGTALDRARQTLCGFEAFWCTASDARIRQELESNTSLFSGTSGEDVSIRCALGVPVAGQDCSNCEGGGGGGGNMALAIAAGVGLAAVLGLALASRGRGQQITIARVVG